MCGIRGAVPTLGEIRKTGVVALVLDNLPSNVTDPRYTISVDAKPPIFIIAITLYGLRCNKSGLG